MIVDTSALMAILLGEPDAVELSQVIAAAPMTSLSAGTYIELAVTTTRRNRPIDPETVDKMIEAYRIEIEPVTADQAKLARQAYLMFGHGRHSAQLNFGDCFAYALAKATGRPLLFKGEDFARTDIVAARMG